MKKIANIFIAGCLSLGLAVGVRAQENRSLTILNSYLPFPFPYPATPLPESTNTLGDQLKYQSPIVAVMPEPTPEPPAGIKVKKKIVISDQEMTPLPLQTGQQNPVTGDFDNTTATADAKTMLHITAITIEGNTAYSDEALQEIVKPLIGKDVAIEQLFNATRQITELYHKDGYFLSQAILPDQRSSNGIFVIKIIEGYISEVYIQGDVGYVKGLISNYLANIPGQVPVKLSDVERYLLLSRDIPGISLNSVFRASVGTLGAREMLVQVGRKSYGGSITADNRGSLYSGPGQFTARGYLVSNTILGEQIDLLYQNSWNAQNFQFSGNNNFMNQQHFVLLNLSGIVYGAEGLTFKVSGAYGPSQPGYGIENYYSYLKSFTAGLTFPIIRSRDFNLSTNLVFNYSNSDSETNDPLTNITTLASRTNLRNLTLSFFTDVTDPLNGNNSIVLSATKGLPIWKSNPASTKGVDKPERPGVRADFTKFNLEITSTHSLWEYNGGQFVNVTIGSAQYALNRLYGNDQFSSGGTRCGRGYYNGRLNQVIASDKGLCGSTEFQWIVDTDLGLDSGPLRPTYFIFYDAAKGWELPPSSGDITGSVARRQPRALTSIGFGVRAVLPNQIQTELELNLPTSISPYGLIPLPPQLQKINKKWGFYFKFGWYF